MVQFTTVYLLRKGNPDSWARAFLCSYRTHVPPEHRRLCILLKNFADDETPAVLSDFTDLQADLFRVDDTGMDLTAYRTLAAQAPDQHYLFMNSHSRILKGNTMQMFATALQETGGNGIIGASGSWETVSECPDFPNPHIRTTGFLIRGADYARLAVGPLESKAECHALEAGSRCLSQRIAAEGAPVLVINADGDMFTADNWTASRTFRLGDQEKLLIADNRSMKFHTGTPSRRQHHARASWGEDTKPKRLGVLTLLRRTVWHRLVYGGHRYRWLSRLVCKGASA